MAEIGVQFDLREGLAHQFGEDVPVEQAVQRRHLPPGQGLHLGAGLGQGLSAVVAGLDDRIQLGEDGDQQGGRPRQPGQMLAIGHEQGRRDRDENQDAQQLPPTGAGARSLAALLQIADVLNRLGVGRLIDTGGANQVLEEGRRMRPVGLLQVGLIVVERFVDVPGQKKVSRAAALVSAVAVKGMRVV
ncbi:hypothetical protein D3C86_710960 [compost metagenome]